MLILKTIERSERLAPPFPSHLPQNTPLLAGKHTHSLRSSCQFGAAQTELSGNVECDFCKLLRLLMRPRRSIISQKIAAHIWPRRCTPLSSLPPPSFPTGTGSTIHLWLDWVAEIAAELSGSLQRRRNLGSAGSLILFTLLLLLALALLSLNTSVCLSVFLSLSHTLTNEQEILRPRISLWITALKPHLAQCDRGRLDILHGQMFVEMWILRPYVVSEKWLIQRLLLQILSSRIFVEDFIGSWNTDAVVLVPNYLHGFSQLLGYQYQI